MRLWTQDSPVGELTIAASDVGICLIEFGAAERARSAVGRLGETSSLTEPTVVDALDEYFEGDSAPLDALPVDLRLVGHETNRRVLTVLREQTMRGETTTYGSLAERSGIPGAAQLVGQIMGANPIPIVIPCHRVVAADGSLGGFSGGLDTKRTLFRVEGIAPLAGGWGRPDYEEPTLF